jgi:hypothetical protein
MLNDAVLLEVTQALGKRAIAHDGKTADRVTYLFRLCLVRNPTADEVETISKFFKSQYKRFKADPNRAATVAGGALNAPERAAWTAAARAILNLDEFITRE